MNWNADRTLTVILFVLSIPIALYANDIRYWLSTKANHTKRAWLRTRLKRKKDKKAFLGWLKDNPYRLTLYVCKILFNDLKIVAIAYLTFTMIGGVLEIIHSKYAPATPFTLTSFLGLFAGDVIMISINFDGLWNWETTVKELDDQILRLEEKLNT